MLRKLNPQLTWLLQNWATHELRKTGLEYPSRSPLTRLGEGSHETSTNARVPRYEPDGAYKRVRMAMHELCGQDRNLLYVKYIEGMSDRVIGLICNCKTGKARWSMEIAHRSIAEKLKIEPYQGRTARR